MAFQEERIVTSFKVDMNIYTYMCVYICIPHIFDLSKIWKFDTYLQEKLTKF